MKSKMSQAAAVSAIRVEAEAQPIRSAEHARVASLRRRGVSLAGVAIVAELAFASTTEARA